MAERDRRSAAIAGMMIATILLVLLWGPPASAFRVIGSSQNGWLRWDAAPRFVGGKERSLDGGLRYSIETGSYSMLRDQFMWVPFPPTEQDFADAIARSFDHWTAVDPATGLPGAIYFVEDLSTVAVDAPGTPGLPATYLGANPGAEIDLFAEVTHAGAAFGGSVVLFVDSTANDLTLTSGTTPYPGRAISGADIRINPGLVWSLRGFETLLTHEIGHALGFADLEAPTRFGSISAFIDDDYDPGNSSAALTTLTNSFALAIDPLDPDASNLQFYAPSLNKDPGLLTPGVELLMESNAIFDLLYQDQKLQHDEFAGRQFLYPVVLPEPGLGLLISIGVLGLGGASTYRSSRASARR